ncbi:MAG: hypothetical protein ACYS1C_06550 [Planctomycetota bacterium]|jgi:cytochrome c-type biogenesis protein CcmH/NrfG
MSTQQAEQTQKKRGAWRWVLGGVVALVALLLIPVVRLSSGQDWMASVHRRLHDKSAEDLCEAILGDVLPKADGQKGMADDMTVLLAKSRTA